MSNVGANLKRIREQRGVTQSELARMVQVSPPMICQIERGSKAPSLPLGAQIAEALGCNLLELLVGADGKQPLHGG